VKVPYTWKPTGWFMIGWSAEFHAAAVRPLRYFGEDLVASPTPPDDLLERVEKEFLVTMWDDLEIWRYQEYVEHPALAKQDARPYAALRRWTQQFYDVPAVNDVAPARSPFASVRPATLAKRRPTLVEWCETSVS
jgi:hypothetical protein